MLTASLNRYSAFSSKITNPALTLTIRLVSSRFPVQWLSLGSHVCLAITDDSETGHSELNKPRN